MARILYMVAGEGNGHATRSAAVIEELKARGHEVVAVSDRMAFSILEGVADKTIEAVTPGMKYQNNTVSAWGTLFQNLVQVPRAVRDIAKLRSFAKKWKPDLIVTDFNPMAAFLSGAPIISLDNQHAITHANIEVPKGCLIEFIKSWIVVKIVVPRAKKRIVTSFFNSPMIHNAASVGPVLSNSLRSLKSLNSLRSLKSSKSSRSLRSLRSSISLKPTSLKPRTGKHLLVYQTTPTNKKLAELLPALNMEIAAYGFRKVGREGKVRFMPFDVEGWQKDLTSCRAVVVNGGFSLITEALHLHKPILCFPIMHQFEQILNAYYLEKEGLGMWAKEISLAEFDSFLKRIKMFEKNISKRSWKDGTKEAVDIIEDVL